MHLSFELDHPLRHFRLQLQQQLDFANGHVALCGANGSGKSTLLRIVAGLEPSQGQIAFGRQPHQRWLQGTKALAVAQRNIGYVAQQSALIPFFTVGQCLQLAWQHSDKSRWSVADMLQHFPELQPLVEQQVARLSGGQRQIAALAMAFLAHPQLMLWDEPFAAMDAVTRQQCLLRCKQLLEVSQTPLVLISHHGLDCHYLCQQMLLLENGQACFSGSVEQGLLRHFKQSHSPIENYCSGLKVESVLRPNFYQAQLGDVPVKGVAQISLQPGQAVLARFNAVDASVFLSQPSGTSISNCLPATITEIEPYEHEVLLALTLAGSLVRVLITPESVAQLALAPGKQVFLLIKGTALELFPVATAVAQ